LECFSLVNPKEVSHLPPTVPDLPPPPQLYYEFAIESAGERIFKIG